MKERDFTNVKYESVMRPRHYIPEPYGLNELQIHEYRERLWGKLCDAFAAAIALVLALWFLCI